MSARQHEARSMAGTMLERMTGFAHAVYVQSGTAALEIVLEVLTSRRDQVIVPALSCWTVPFAVQKMRRRSIFADVDDTWSARIGGSARAGAAVLVDPWGAPSQWRRADDRARIPVWIADLTQSPGARLDGERPARWCDAAFISFGVGKPIGLGGGAVALFRDKASADEAARMLRFGFHDGRWIRQIDRYTFSPHLFEPLVERLKTLEGRESMDDALAARDALTRARLASNALPEGASWGSMTALPVVFGRDFPLSTGELEAVALSSGVPLSRHPVAPAFRQPAWRGARTWKTPRARAIAERLMFFAPQRLNEAAVRTLRAFLSQVEESPVRFRSPYELPRRRGSLVPEIEAMLKGSRLVRDIHGQFGLFDEELSLMLRVSDEEAAVVQTRRARRG
jgi:dTDP-4-amino-4,6-dideoxygalactose transaminase